MEVTGGGAVTVVTEGVAVVPEASGAPLVDHECITPRVEAAPGGIRRRRSVTARLTLRLPMGTTAEVNPHECGEAGEEGMEVIPNSGGNFQVHTYIACKVEPFCKDHPEKLVPVCMWSSYRGVPVYLILHVYWIVQWWSLRIGGLCVEVVFNTDSTVLQYMIVDSLLFELNLNVMVKSHHSPTCLVRMYLEGHIKSVLHIRDTISTD